MDFNLFKKYDIRGVAEGANAPLTPTAAHHIGRAVATHLLRQHDVRRAVVGHDNRRSSPALYAALCGGLAASGVDVLQVGEVSTPLIYWQAVQASGIGGVMVTGSHLAPHYNGVKLSVGSVNLYGDVLQAIAQHVRDGDYTQGSGAVTTYDMRAPYVQDIARRVPLARAFRVVIDAGNGTGGVFAQQLLQAWGQDVTGIYLESDGGFPNHLPNPQDEANMRDLAAKVREVGADVGFAFDGDADRVGVVDENGRMIAADRVLALLARDLLLRHTGAVVVGEVLCSQVLFDAVKAAGGMPVMVASGHSIVKDAMRTHGALLGGEMSGHIFVGEDYYGVDDAFLVMGRILQLMQNSGQPLSALDDTLPRLYSTPEYRPHCPDEAKARVLAAAAQALAGAGVVDTVDGVRVTFANGWGIVRASNTEPVLSLRFEAASEAEAHAIRQQFAQVLAQFPEVAAWG